MNIERKGKITALLICISFVATVIFTPIGYAQGFKVNNLDSFKEELNGLAEENPNLDPNDKQVKALIKETNPRILESFLDEKFDLVQEYLDENKVIKEPNKAIDLGDNCSFVIKNTTAPTIELQSTPGAQTLWKDYGSRKYTCTFEGNFLIASFSLNLCNHYTLSAKGITPRYPEAWGSGAGMLSVSHGAINEPKRSATVGETVSMNCIFKVSAHIGVGIGEKSIRMNNFVKCSAIDKVEKQVKVVQSWRGDYL